MHDILHLSKQVDLASTESDLGISTVDFIDIDSIKSGNKCTTLTQKMFTLEMLCRRWENGTLCTVC